jgi:hypothetical protein
MKGTIMSRTIEAIAAHLLPMKGRAITSGAKQLTANWQNGLESGRYIQRKLRLAFSNPSAQRPAN